VTKWSRVKSNRTRDGGVSPTVRRDLLIAVVALVPALVAGAASADGGFVAVDYAWRANGTDATTLTVAPGATLTFGYPEGTNYHDVLFTGPQPACEGLPPAPQAKGWQGQCTFADPGTYPFVCERHDRMTGSVVVAAPTLTPAPTATAEPGPTPTPPPVPDTAQTALTVELAAKQRGTRVRGTVEVRPGAAKLEVTVTARLKKAPVRVGRWVKTSPASGRVAFSVALDARARRALRSSRRLSVSVAVALTETSGARLTRSAKVLIRPR
jgi:plastocyanin